MCACSDRSPSQRAPQCTRLTFSPDFLSLWGDPDTLCSAEIGARDAICVARWPLYKLDAVSIRAANETGLGAVMASWTLRLVEGDALLAQLDQYCVEVVDLHHDVAEAGADLDRIELGIVNQLQGH